MMGRGVNIQINSRFYTVSSKDYKSMKIEQTVRVYTFDLFIECVVGNC